MQRLQLFEWKLHWTWLYLVNTTANTKTFTSCPPSQKLLPSHTIPYWHNRARGKLSLHQLRRILCFCHQSFKGLFFAQNKAGIYRCFLSWLQGGVRPWVRHFSQKSPVATLLWHSFWCMERTGRAVLHLYFSARIVIIPNSVNYGLSPSTLAH